LMVMVLLVPALATAGMGGGKMLKEGTDAPVFKFKTIAGKETDLTAYAGGKPVLLVFLQTACRSCQREMAFLKELTTEGGVKVNILAVFVDMRERDFKAYVDENKLPFNFTWDKDYSVADMYGVSFTPSSFLIDSKGVVAKVYRGWSRAGEKIGDDIKAVSGM